MQAKRSRKSHRSPAHRAWLKFPGRRLAICGPALLHQSRCPASATLSADVTRLRFLEVPSYTVSHAQFSPLPPPRPPHACERPQLSAPNLLEKQCGPEELLQRSRLAPVPPPQWLQHPPHLGREAHPIHSSVQLVRSRHAKAAKDRGVGHGVRLGLPRGLVHIQHIRSQHLPPPRVSALQVHGGERRGGGGRLRQSCRRLPKPPCLVHRSEIGG